LSIRRFATGAIRDTATGKYEYARHLDSRALRRYVAYMHHHRNLSDGSTREPDNWKAGMGESYVDSLWRHVMDVWELDQWGSATDHRTGKPVDMEEALCGVLFNAFGKLYEVLKAKAAAEKGAPAESPTGISTESE
jgi:hypothetical protein